MAFDLDDEELRETRKMHKSRYINVGSIEENIKILENLKSYLNLLVYEGKDKIIYNDLLWDEKTVDCINAIEYLINDYKRQKQINEEHQKINGELREKVKELEKENRIFALEGSKIKLSLYIKENYIPKQKIKEFKEQIKLAPIIVGGRRNKKTLEYGIELGKIKACEELLEDT